MDLKEILSQKSCFRLFILFQVLKVFGKGENLLNHKNHYRTLDKNIEFEDFSLEILIYILGEIDFFKNDL